MAFKMKGSAFKLGNVATKSALKHPAEGWSKQGGRGAGHTTHDDQHSQGWVHDPNDDTGANNWKKKEEETEGTLEMKTPLEQDIRGTKLEKVLSKGVDIAKETGKQIFDPFGVGTKGVSKIKDLFGKIRKKKMKGTLEKVQKKIKYPGKQ